MKKILIPILSMAAVAPIATTAVACSSSINMKFDETGLDGEPGFVLKNFNVEANKEYKFSIDMSKASTAAIKHWGDDPLVFVCFSTDSERLNIVKDKIRVLFNDKDITNVSGRVVYEEGVITITHSGGDWASTDKLVITVAWEEKANNAMVRFGHK